MTESASNLRIAVIGPGALGTLFAARLGLAGITASLLDYRPERATQLAQSGLRLLDNLGERSVRIPVSADPHILEDVHIALVFVKAYQTELIAATLADHLPQNAAAVTLQNGLGNVESLQSRLGQNRVFGGAAALGALLESPGAVKDTGGASVVLGHPLGTADPLLDELCEALLIAGFTVSITPDLPAAIWTKAILNAAANPVAALTRLQNKELAAHEPSLQLMSAAAQEAAEIAKAHGVHIPDQDWRQRMHDICQITGENINSMLQDVLQQRRTEIDAINGAIVKVAEQHQLAAPVNRTLWRLINTLESTYDLQLTKH